MNPNLASQWLATKKLVFSTAGFGTFVACCTAGAGLLVLFGWSQDNELLKRVVPGFTAMNPLAAVCFVLSGFGVALNVLGKNRAAFLCGTAVAVLASLKILDLALVGVPIDQFLFSAHLDSEEIPNRMAPNTAAAFLLAGLSLFFLGVERREKPLVSQALASSVLLISVFALVGYGFGIDQLNRVGPFIPMAIHTALLLLILSVGLLSLRPDCGLMLVLRDRGAAGSMARTVLPLAILIPVGVGAIRLWGQEEGYYGTEAGVALQVIANVVVTSVLLIASIAALFQSDSTRRRREQALARSEAQYRLAERVAKVGHWRMDIPGLTVSWSDELFRICGVPAKNGPPTAAEVLDIYHPDDREIMRRSVRAALRDGVDWERNVRISRPDGELRYVNSQGVCERDKEGTVTGLFGVFADTTELEHARREAEAATAAKAAFLANMSHEIRTPLNGVMGFAELLLAADLPAEQKRQASLISESARILLKLLNDILDLSKIDAGQLEVAREPFDLAHQLRQCVRLMEAPAQKKNLEISLKLDPKLPQHILGDGLRLRQVILNLLGNAVKFTDCGFVMVEASACSGPANDRRIQISVADSGVGIADDRQAAVFEEFLQADASTSRRYGGSGLGLSITRRLVSLMDGELALVSKEGVGTRVTVTLPLEVAGQVSPPVSQPQVEAADLDHAQQLAQRDCRVLLVEDLDINQELLKAMLSRMGCHVDLASDGAEAIRLAEQLNDQPDRYHLIFMDVQMPIVDGLSATRAIRALGGRAAEIPIIALTANAYASEVEECREAGMDDHVSKPVSMAALGAAVTRWLPGNGGKKSGGSAAVAVQPTVADKFSARLQAYAERLDEIRNAFPQASAESRQSLLTEAQKMAHNVAGTAGMCGQASLGDLAAEIEDFLKRWPDASDDAVEVNISEFASTLRRAA